VGFNYNGRNAREWYNLYTELNNSFGPRVDALEERIDEYQDNLMEANTRNEELLEQNETQKCDIDLLETRLHLEEKKVKELKEQLENNRIWRANSKTLWKGKVLEKQRMYNKVIRLSIILFILLVFSVLR
jgi:DNA repair exonuclease SbcCD ATPase subunit